jgi:hypothetical protein
MPQPFWRIFIFQIDVNPAKTRKRRVLSFNKDVAPKELLLIGIKLCDYVSSTYDRQVSGEKKSP